MSSNGTYTLRFPPLTCTIDETLGSGSTVIVYELNTIEIDNPECPGRFFLKDKFVLKETKKSTPPSLLDDHEGPSIETLARYISHGFDVLERIYSGQEKPIKGIQSLPIAKFKITDDSGRHTYGLIESRYDDVKTLLTPCSRPEICQKLLSLFEGLRFLHANEIAHGDIKLANLGVRGSELFFTDFGGAKSKTELDECDIMGIHSRVSKNDEILALQLASVSCGGIETAQMKAIVKANVKRLLGMRVDPNVVLSIIKAAKTPLEPHHIDAFELKKAFDVYCLGMMIKELFGDHFLEANPGLAKLLAEMCSEDPVQRPTSSDAFIRYQQLCSNNFNDISLECIIM